MPKRREKKEESMELESGGMMRWLITYADMLTLLFALFVILFALAAAEQKKAFQEVAAQFRAVFGVIPGGTTVLPAEGTNQGVMYKIIAGEPREGGPGGIARPTPVAGTGGDLEGELRRKLERQLGARKVRIRREARGLVVSLLTDKLLFDLGDTALKPELKEILGKIADVLKKHPQHDIAVEGHTDDLPMRTASIPSNWELSALRATAVVKHLVTAEGLDPARLSAAGYGEHQPLVPNISEANRRLNRRVDIVILKLD